MNYVQGVLQGIILNFLFPCWSSAQLVDKEKN